VSGHGINRDLAAALRRQAQRTGERAPSVRGGDWRLATVTAVNTDGTVDADGIPSIRCMEWYSLPAVGDLIRIDQSSSGNWLAMGRLSTATGTPWTALTPAAGFTAGQGSLDVAQFRIITAAGGGRRVELRGALTSSTNLTAPTVCTTFPTAARPSAPRTWAAARNYSADTKGAVRVELATTGTLTVFASATTSITTWLCLDSCYYEL
jgi:hypothetical protein